MNLTEPVKLLHSAVHQTKIDLKEVGGSNSLREKLGVEVHLKWRVMYNIEKILVEQSLESKYYQSLETRTVKDRKCDFGIYTRKSVSPTTIPFPVLIAEFKFTDRAHLEKEVNSDFPKLIDLAKDQFQEGNKIYFGSVIYLQRERVEIEGFVAEKYCPNLYADNHNLLSNYFEFIIREIEDDVVVNTKIDISSG